jgi:GR25 family glycosyltransferase involved in LPS biosynthesis
VTKIQTYIINIPARTDRKQHILDQFANRPEFNVEIIEAKEHTIGAWGLWLTIRSILMRNEISDFEHILICEDDHLFTKAYNPDSFFKSIEEAEKKGADILSGGVSWFNNALAITDYLFWCEKFTGFQFTVVFRKFYKTILNLEFKMTDAVDRKISDQTVNKYFIHPFLSVQQDFGYSDVTSKNNSPGRVADLFIESEKKAGLIRYICNYYQRNIQKFPVGDNTKAFENFTIPTYIINLPERKDRLAHIIDQFKDRPEFNLNIVEACRHECGAVGLWQSIVKVVGMAIENDDDVIIICEDDHQFTEHYSKNDLIRNIFEAHYHRVEILSGGIGGFDIAVPVSRDKFWIRSFYSTQFIILFKSAFSKIIDLKYDDGITSDGAFSAISTYKMTMFPSISTQKEFGYSDVTKWNNGVGAVSRWFVSASDRLELALRMYSELNPKFLELNSGIPPFTRSLNNLLEDISRNESDFKSAVNITFQKEKKTRIDLSYPEHKMNVVIPFYNCSNFIKECYESLIGQEYKNFKFYFINDYSSDNAHSLIPLSNTAVLKNNDCRQYALGSLYSFFSTEFFSDDEVMLIVDGDDFLLNNHVLSAINKIYRDKDCLLTYGQYCYSNGRIGHCKSYSEADFSNLRRLDWRASHLKTFKYRVFKEFLNRDPNAGSWRDTNGAFYKMSYDIAMMTPLMEISGYNRVFFNETPVYGYRLHDNNDSEIDLELQTITARKIIAKEPFERCF